jgi:hypothetical protein
VSDRIRIGIDLGGTKIEAAAVRGESEVLWRERVPTPQGDYDATVRAVAGLVARLAGDEVEDGDGNLLPDIGRGEQFAVQRQRYVVDGGHGAEGHCGQGGGRCGRAGTVRGLCQHAGRQCQQQGEEGDGQSVGHGCLADGGRESNPRNVRRINVDDQ